MWVNLRMELVGVVNHGISKAAFRSLQQQTNVHHHNENSLETRLSSKGRLNDNH